MLAVVEIVCRPFIGRPCAGPVHTSAVVARRSDSGRWSQPFQLSTSVGLTMGGVAGGVPPHEGGPKARPLNCSGQ